MLLAAPRGEQMDVSGGMAVDALEYVEEVVVGVDVVQAAGDDEALQGGHRLGADLAPAKQPRLATHRNRAQRPLQVVGIDGHVGVVIEAKLVRAVLPRNTNSLSAANMPRPH